MTLIRPFEYTSDEDMTLDDLEAFCRNARTAGATRDDQLKVRVSFKGGLRTIKIMIGLDHNREASHRKDQSR